MRLYHWTPSPDAVLRDGFRGDVWLSDEPIRIDKPVEGVELLALEIPRGVVEPFAQASSDLGVREFLVPGDVLNRFGPPERLGPWE